ncbi:MAG TPA: uL22 family ribosomal protein [Patescibacteria group bacterium]|nr:uL22 family ribosomal protein [Patescibacteria group bacterium]
METSTYIKHTKTSPKKLRLVAKSIKKMPVRHALDTLSLSRTRASKILYKSILSALDTFLSSSKEEMSMVQFKLLTIEEGSRLKRFRSGSKGNAKPYRRKMSHIKIILTTQTQN